MKNQYSFRLTTTLLPWGTTAKTTQVINKVDSDGNKFYPTFTEETVVLTNDDRTIIETTRATCNNWVLTFVKRGLSDDNSATPVDNRKLTWNPGSLCFVTAGASDRIDKDDDIVWSWDQTYSGDMESRWKATYKWRLITEKWVEYPHFDSLEELQDYESPFGWMFAVVDSDWELYRYNAVDEEWAVVTTSTPAQPAKASESAIGTVRVATDAEFEAWTDQWSNDEYLMATLSQIKSLIPSLQLNKTTINQSSATSKVWWTTLSKSYTTTKAWFITVEWYEETSWGSTDVIFSVDNASYFYWPAVATDEINTLTVDVWWNRYYPKIWIKHVAVLAVPANSTITANVEILSSATLQNVTYVKFLDYFYFE